MPSDSNLYFDDGRITHEFGLLSSSQADNVMSVIGDYNEIVLYCGNEDEVETYMVLCDFWKEWVADSKWLSRVDSLSAIEIAQEEDSLFDQYEIWVLGYDLHTGDTICTPISPSCIWIHKNDITYNVGSYTSLDSIVRLFPFNWKVPQYSLISCLEYNEEIQPTHHYEIHVLGYFAPFDYRPLPPPYYQGVKRKPHDDRGYSQTGRTRTGSARTSTRNRVSSNRNNSSDRRNNGNQSSSGRNNDNGNSNRSGEHDRERMDASQMQKYEQVRRQNENQKWIIEQERKRKVEQERQRARRQQEEQARRQADQQRLQQQEHLRKQQEELSRKQKEEQQRLEKQREEKLRQQQTMPNQFKAK